MEYFNKVSILNKYFKKYNDDENLVDMHNTLKSMKTIHGRIIDDMIGIRTSNESNKLEVLSDLQILSNKISEVIDDASNIYDILEGKKEDEENKKSLHVSPDKSNKVLKKDSPSLVLFYADWCGPCKMFLPTWNMLEEKINHPNLNLVKFSCVEHKEKCEKLNFIKGFPTLVIFDASKGENAVIPFNGERNVKSIVDFVNSVLKLNVEYPK